MLLTVLQIVVNTLVVLAIIYGFHIIGQIANNKFFGSRFKYPLPIGFAWFMITFQLISYPFILKQTSFSLFLMFLIPFGLLWLLYIFFNRKHIKWIVDYKNGQFIIGLLIIVSAVFIIKSIVYSDSWLYSAMITSTIENNLIYSNNGTLADVQLSIMHHRFESYYLWQAVVAMFFTGNYLVALITEYKILDAFLLVFTFLELGNQFKFSKLKSVFFAFSLFIMLQAQSTFLDVSPFQTTEPPVQFFQVSTGTALFHYLVIPYAIIYLFVEKQLNYKQKNIYLLGLLFAFSSLSTTYYYTLPLFYITILFIKHVFRKQKDNQIALAFMICWMLIIMSYIGILSSKLIYTITFAIIFLVITKLILFIYKKLSIKVLRIASIIILGLYPVIAILLFNPAIFMSVDFTVNKYSLRFYNPITNYVNGTYSELVLPIIFGLFVLGLIIVLFTNKRFKDYTLYLIIYTFLFLNPFALTLYRIIGVEPVISRIFAFSFLGYLIIICAFMFEHKIIVKALLMVWVIIATGQTFVYLPNNISDKRTYVAAMNAGIDGLANYNFEDDSFIVFDNLDSSISSEVYYVGINKLIVLNPSLSWDPAVRSCDQLYDNPEYSAKFKHCYTVYDKDKAEDLNYVYETDKHLVSKNF